MSDRLVFFIIYFSTFLVQLSVHESSHAWVASRFGDDTAKNLGRISLNPIRHMDIVGTFLLPIALFFSGVRIPIGGWGKPVPVNYYNLKNPRKDALWIALAGPVSNILMAILSALILRGILYGSEFLGIAGPDSMPTNSVFAITLLLLIFKISVFVNLGLAFFNLIPLHPLDGGKVIEGLLPASAVAAYNQIAKYGFVIIFALYYTVGFSFISKPVFFLADLLIPKF